MPTFWIFFWGLLILSSIVWYGGLIFVIGLKAGRDIRQLIQSLTRHDV